MEFITEQKVLRRLEKRLGWQDVRKVVEKVKGEPWECFRDRHGDWGRDLALYLARRHGGLRLPGLAGHAGTDSYGAVSKAVRRMTVRLKKDKQIESDKEDIMEKVVVRDWGYAERTVGAEGIRPQVSGGRVRPLAGRGRVPAPRINCAAVFAVASLTLSAFAQSTATNRPASPAEPPAWPIGLRLPGITYHGEGPTWPIPSWAAKQDRSILYVCANGQEEWDGTWYRHVRPFLLNYRANNAWLPHQVAGVGVGHGNYADTHGGVGWGKPVPEGAMSVLRIWDYLAMFADKALTLRLPGKGYPTDGPLKLRTVDPDAGYLVHPRAIETLLATKWLALREKDGEYKTIPWPDEVHPVYDTEQGAVALKLFIRKAQDVPAAERRGLLWIPDRELAEAWLKLHNIKAMDVGIP